MRKVFTLLVTLIIVGDSFASVNVIEPKINSAQIFFPIKKTGRQISLLELSKINWKDFQILTGRKMNLFNRIEFKIVQKKLRNSIDSGNNREIKKIINYSEQRSDFDFVGFALGFFLFPIGVLIAYLINDDKKKSG